MKDKIMREFVVEAIKSHVKKDRELEEEEIHYEYYHIRLSLIRICIKLRRAAFAGIVHINLSIILSSVKKLAVPVVACRACRPESSITKISS